MIENDQNYKNDQNDQNVEPAEHFWKVNYEKNHEYARGHDRFADVSFLRTHDCAHSPKDCCAGLIFSKTKLFLRN